MKTKLFCFIMFISGTASLFAQVPEPVAYFPFNTDFTDCREMISAFVPEDGNVEIGEGQFVGNVAIFPGDDPDDAVLTDSLNYIELNTDAYAFDAVTYNIWFNADTVLTWSRIITFSTLKPDGRYPEFFITPASGRKDKELSVNLDAGWNPEDAAEYLRGPELRGGLIEAGEWYMVTVSQDSTHLKLWLNGELKGDTVHTIGKPVDLAVRKGMLGRGGWPDPLFKGKMKSFAIFDEVLSNEDVESIYHGWWMPGCDYDYINTGNSSLDIVVSSSKNRICITSRDNVLIKSVQIYTTSGKLVYGTNDFSENIHHNLPSGMYIMRIQSNQGDYKTKIAVE